MRQAEVCGLKLVNIDRDRHVMKVTGKGDKDRFVHFAHELVAAKNSFSHLDKVFKT